MSDEGWVRLGDCEPGTLVELVASGTQWLFTGFVLQPDDGTPPTYELHGVGTDEVMFQSPDLLVYPLTAVRLHPSLRGSDLPGLCAAVLADPNEGTMARLLDWLGDALGRDPDVAAAVRERCARVADGYATDCRTDHPVGSPDRMFDHGRVRAGLDIADRIRALGRSAATGGCEVCGGAKVIDSGGVTPWGEPVNTECPNCTTPPAATAAACGRCGAAGGTWTWDRTRSPGPAPTAAARAGRPGRGCEMERLPWVDGPARGNDPASRGEVTAGDRFLVLVAVKGQCGDYWDSHVVVATEDGWDDADGDPWGSWSWDDVEWFVRLDRTTLPDLTERKEPTR